MNRIWCRNKSCEYNTILGECNKQPVVLINSYGECGSKVYKGDTLEEIPQEDNNE